MPTYQTTRSILTRLQDSEAPIVIYQPGLVSHPDVAAAQRYNGYITDLRMKTKISSLAETPLPEFELGESKSAKMAVVRDLEYNSPRYNLEILLKNAQQDWLSIFEFAVHCRRPFFVTEVLGYLTQLPAYTIAPDTILGMQFTDVGYGLPQGTDHIHLYGVVREEWSLPDPPIIIQSVLPVDPNLPDDTDMADLTPISAALTLETAFDNAYQSYQNYPDGLSYRLLIWPSLKLAHLEFTLEASYPSQEAVMLSWAATYTAGAKHLYVPLVFHGEGKATPPNAWGEVRGNQLLMNLSGAAAVDGGFSGSVVFRIP